MRTTSAFPASINLSELVQIIPLRSRSVTWGIIFEEQKRKERFLHNERKETTLTDDCGGEVELQTRVFLLNLSDERVKQQQSFDYLDGWPQRQPGVAGFYPEEFTVRDGSAFFFKEQNHK